MDYLKKQIEDINRRIEETKKLLGDPAMSRLAEQEIKSLETEKQNLLSITKQKGTNDNDIEEVRSIIAEIRAAAGGNEAGIFATDIYRMYTRYAETQGWKVEQLSVNEGGIGNVKEVVFRIEGKDVYEKLKNESGVHRVQRVPATESSGRIHTSTITVAILPEIPESNFSIDPKDLRIETYRASGHGGQNVQKVETAVRITHSPTQLVVTCQSERSQFQNKERAMQILRSRLFEAKRQSDKEGIDITRKLQVGAGDRSEKIRTYNFPQDRITDHRVGKSWHNIESILDGNLGPIISKLATL